ncbi:MAG: thiolase family protein [Proteobacteria bacterium]|nr:thiolase family protein [Pseudomonadota bacterium]
MTTSEKDYPVIIDLVRTPFAQASRSPQRLSARDVMGQEWFDNQVKAAMKAGASRADAVTAFTKPVFTPKSTDDNKIGRLAHLSPGDLVAPLVRSLLERTGANPHDIESNILGVVHQEGEQGMCLGRVIAIRPDSNLPVTVQGDSVDKFCASSMRTIDMAAGDLVRGNAKIVLVGGVQSMSRVPMGGANTYIDVPMFEANDPAFANMGVTAENLREYQEISRKMQEEFALKSHQKAHAAQLAGRFKDEIIPIDGLDHDDCVKEDTSLDKMKELNLAFFSEKNGGTITAATASPTNDGAAMGLMSMESYARANSLPVLGRIIATAGAGVSPHVMGIGPLFAFEKALERAGLQAHQIQCIESNEAFCYQTMTCLLEGRNMGMDVNMDIVNIDGGATGIGHPLGGSGARLVGHMMRILKREGWRYGAAMMCVGLGQGMCIIGENPDYTIDAPAPRPQ